MHLFYKDPQQGSAERFSKWYENYPKTRFILAHMNFHDPGLSFDLCEEFENLSVDTSWQPTEVIGEAVRRVGAERVLFGSDWPLIGNNMSVGRQRIQECIDIGLLNQQQARLILGENANQLLGLTLDAN
jgi:predicted TIM-barrel fold metal-dependent hydrolase